MLTRWAGVARSSTGSGFTVCSPGAAALSSCPILLLLALERRVELRPGLRRGDVGQEFAAANGGTRWCKLDTKTYFTVDRLNSESGNDSLAAAND